MANTLKCPSSGYSYNYGHTSKTGSGKTEAEAQSDALSKFGAGEEKSAQESALKDANQGNSCAGNCKLGVDMGNVKYVQTGKVTQANNVEVTVQSQVPVVLSCAPRQVTAALFRAEPAALPMAEMIVKAFETRSCREIADSPVFALQGVSEGDAELLQRAFNVKTVRDFATLKFVDWAQHIVAVAESESGAG